MTSLAAPQALRVVRLTELLAPTPCALLPAPVEVVALLTAQQPRLATAGMVAQRAVAVVEEA